MNDFNDLPFGFGFSNHYREVLGERRTFSSDGTVSAPTTLVMVNERVCECGGTYDNFPIQNSTTSLESDLRDR